MIRRCACLHVEHIAGGGVRSSSAGRDPALELEDRGGRLRVLEGLRELRKHLGDMAAPV